MLKSQLISSSYPTKCYESHINIVLCNWALYYVKLCWFFIEFVPALEGRAVINLQMGNTFAALQDINASINVRPSAELLTNRGVIHQVGFQRNIIFSWNKKILYYHNSRYVSSTTVAYEVCQDPASRHLVRILFMRETCTRTGTIQTSDLCTRTGTIQTSDLCGYW